MAPEHEISERMVRVETKLDFVISRMETLPPSPLCIAKHKEIDLRFEAIEKWQNRLAGAFLALNLVFILAIEKVKRFFFGASQ